MAPEPLTAERVYAKLKFEIVNGRYKPRALLVSQAIAAEQGTSISPVRDAMHRLVGERLLDPQVGGGFQMSDITTEGLRELYAWHELLTRLAIGELNGAPLLESCVGLEDDMLSAAGYADLTSKLFSVIADGVENQELRYALRSAGERLHCVRRYEARLIRNVGAELRLLWAQVMRGPGQTLRNEIKAYHRRRLRRVNLLHSAMHNPEFSDIF